MKKIFSILFASALTAQCAISYIGKPPSSWATNAWTYDELTYSLVFVGNTYPLTISPLSWGWELIFAATPEDATNYWTNPSPNQIGCPVIDIYGNAGESTFTASVSVWSPQVTSLVVALHQTLDAGSEATTAFFELGPIWQCGSCAAAQQTKGHNKQPLPSPK